MYINNHTYFSLRYGTISPDELLQLATHYHVQTLALTDINSTSACLDFVRLSIKYQIAPVVGVDFRNGVKQEFVMLAQNNIGFQHINTYLSDFLHQNRTTIPNRAHKLPHTFVIYPFKTHQHFSLDAHEYLGVRPSDINHLRFSNWNSKRDKLVALQSVSFKGKRDFNAHRLLRAIDNNTLLSKLPTKEQGSPDDMMFSVQELKALYKDYSELIANSTDKKTLLRRHWLQVQNTRRTYFFKAGKRA